MQVLSKVPTTGETRQTKLLGQQLFAIDSQGGEGEKVVTWTVEFTLEQAKSDGEYGGT